MNRSRKEEIDTERPEIHITQIEMSSMDSFDSHIPQFVDRITLEVDLYREYWIRSLWRYELEAI